MGLGALGVVCGAGASLWLAACTTSENQLFSPLTPNGTSGTMAARRDAAAEDAGPQDRDAASPTIDAGVPVLRNPDLNPDAEFVWVETQPGSGQCETGVYSGSFLCTFESGDPRVTGSITFELGPASESQGLPIVDSQVAAFVGIASQAFTAKLLGTLACAARTFTATTTDERTFPLASGGDFDESGWFSPDFEASDLSGTLLGEFDGDALEIEGDVVLRSESTAPCTGRFSVRRAR